MRAYAAVAAPIIVIAVLLMQGMTTPGYDPVSQTISELGGGWGGTRVIGWYGFIVLTCVWEPLAKSLRPRISVGVLVAALVAIGAGCIGLAVFDAAPWPWNGMSWQGRLHLISAFVFVFAAMPIACFAASRAIPVEWRGLRRFSFATGLSTFAVFGGTLMALGASPPAPFVVSHLGWLERADVFAFLIWQCIVSANVVRFGDKGTR